MPVRALKSFLDSHRVKYVLISHSPAYTAQETARSSHVPGDAFAKTVMVRLDGRLAMVVLRATDKLDLRQLRRSADVDDARLADEDEFRGRFPSVEIGAMPPFGNLYDMAVYADQALARNEDIVFNAGDHHEVMRLSWADYERLVSPAIVAVATHEAAISAEDEA